MKQSEKNIRIKNGKHPTVNNPNIVRINLTVIILMLITEKQVNPPIMKSNIIEPDVLYPTEKAARRVSKRHINPIII
jgi:hypothetical protein